MSELADVFGDDFAEDYEETRQEKREKRNRVEEETLKEICYKAVNGGFKGEEPRFTYEGDAIPHDVFLVQAPDSKFHKFKRQFENGGMSVGMFHMEDVYGCNFNEEMVNLVDRIEEGKHYIAIGNFKEERRTSNGEENVYKNINIRGFVPIAAAKKYAQQRDEQKSESSIEEQKEDQGIEDGDTGTVTEVTDEDVMEVIKAVKGKKPDVLRDVADGDEEAFDNLVKLVDKNKEGDVDEDHVYEVFESQIEEIDDEEEEDDDDDIGLDDLDMDDDEDDSSEETTSDDESEEDTSSDESSDEDEDDADDIDEWFGE